MVVECGRKDVKDIIPNDESVRDSGEKTKDMYIKVRYTKIKNT